MQRDELVSYLNTLLRIDQIRDSGPQGLQVEGRETVDTIVGTVDAQLPCLQAAREHGADLLLVHHGIFWGTVQKLSGGFGRLVRAYLESNINLYGAHLPLDAHPEFGNNAELARLLGIEVEEWWGEAKGTLLATAGSPGADVSLDALVARFERAIGAPLHVDAGGPRICRKVGILSGFGAPQIEEAAALGCDTFITGETSHSHYYAGSANGLNVIYGGHYATETVGVKALGAHLADRFGITFHFVDLPTGM